jgi:hypothetical protein
LDAAQHDGETVVNAVTAQPQSKALTLEQVLIGGDLSKLDAGQRVDYYSKLCTSIGLNPLSRPFEYLTLNGKLVLYARRDAADQLRKINGISIEIVSKSIDEGLMTIHVRAKDRDGRTDEDYGVVNIGPAKGEQAANAVLKCVTKAKRRVTLSISGLGFLDETEVEDIPASAKGAVTQPPAARIASPPPAPPPAPKANGTAPLSEADQRAIDREGFRDMAHETPEHDAETGEVGPRALPLPTASGKPDWRAWGVSVIAAFKTAEDASTLTQWLQENEQTIDTCENVSPKIYGSVILAYKASAKAFGVEVEIA